MFAAAGDDGQLARVGVVHADDGAHERLVGSVAFGAASLALLHGGPDRDLVYKEGWSSGTTLPAYWVSLFISLAGAMLAVALHRLVAGTEARLE